MRHCSPVVLALACSSLAAAGGTLTDPEGDAVAIVEGSMLIDLAGIDVRYDEDTLYFEITFFTPIAPASAGAPNSVQGLLEFDQDQDPSTGLPAVQNQWAPPFDELVFGAQYAVFLAAEVAVPGHMALRGTDGSTEIFPVTFTDYSVSGSFPLSYFSDGDGIVDFAATIGDGVGPTDAVSSVGTSCAVCPSDLSGDGSVDVADLLMVLAAWGTDAGDVTGDGTTDVTDLLAVLSAWGGCA